jgi:hypothetical protein
MPYNRTPYLKGEAVTDNRALNRLKEAWEENPVAVIGVTATAVFATAKLLSAMTEASNSRTYKKEVNRRIKNPRR